MAKKSKQSTKLSALLGATEPGEFTGVVEFVIGPADRYSMPNILRLLVGIGGDSYARMRVQAALRSGVLRPLDTVRGRTPWFSRHDVAQLFADIFADRWLEVVSALLEAGVDDLSGLPSSWLRAIVDAAVRDGGRRWRGLQALLDNPWPTQSGEGDVATSAEGRVTRA